MSYVSMFNPAFRYQCSLLNKKMYSDWLPRPPIMSYVDQPLIRYLLCYIQAIQKGNMEGARIHAENAIRQKNQALNYRRMSARVDAVAARVQTALTTKQVTSSMAGVCKAMESALKSMNLEKVIAIPDVCMYSTGLGNLLPEVYQCIIIRPNCYN